MCQFPHESPVLKLPQLVFRRDLNPVEGGTLERGLDDVAVPRKYVLMPAYSPIFNFRLGHRLPIGILGRALDRNRHSSGEGGAGVGNTPTEATTSEALLAADRAVAGLSGTAGNQVSF